MEQLTIKQKGAGAPKLDHHTSIASEQGWGEKCKLEESIIRHNGKGCDPTPLEADWELTRGLGQ